MCNNSLAMNRQPILRDLSRTVPDPTEVGEREFAKSAATRTRILRAAMGLLADNGYAATSTTAVATAAGLSRTAMLYHFPSRRALLDAVVRFVTRRRVEMQEEMQGDLPRDEHFRPVSVDMHWQQLQSVEFKAFCELSMAARTDEALAEVFDPALEAFDRARREMALKLAEPEVADAPGFDLKRDLHRFLLEGIAQQNGITFNRDQRLRQVMAFIKLCWSEEGQAFIERAIALSEQQENRVGRGE